MDMISAIRAGTFNNLQLNAGAFIMNFDMSSYTTAAALRTALQTALAAGTNVLGATRGGGTFVIDRETRDPDIDGRRYRFKGGTFVDSIDAHLTGTLVELKTDVLTKLMASGRATTSGAKTTITMSTTVATSDYINTLTWVGDLAGGGVIAITLKNALNVGGLTLTFQDKNEGTIPFDFYAHQDSVTDYDTPPFEVVVLAAASQG